MSATLPSADPARSASVSASAGTGKTWLLVARLIRLLLAGARPEGILAVTFTRKAAAEMQQRLDQRLLELAQCDEAQLERALADIGLRADDGLRRQARALFETLHSAPLGIKTATFHAFCQDILRRFPLEAGVPPGFELQETTGEFQREAWDALCAEASRAPDGALAQALETLLDTCGGLDNTRTALLDFLHHRSDWWAYAEGNGEGNGEGRDDSARHAGDALARQLGITPEEDPRQAFFHDLNLQRLHEFAGLLQKHTTATNLKHLAALAIAREPNEDWETRFAAACAAFVKQDGEPFARKESKTQAQAMGAQGQQRYLQLHNQICAAIQATRERLAAQLTLRRSTAWYQAGQALLGHFQRLKAEQRVLDFADLEWQAYRLLNRGDNVHWVQYKLDQRIDHLLIDEFQDTNPTQWRLLLPLLQELAAGGNERGRSVFLVGDAKQSIYRFRRGDPQLFSAAQAWLQEHLHAVTQPLDTSWRSAGAIMDFVNRLFASGALAAHLPQFHPHRTHHTRLWGQVDVLPLAEATPTETISSEGLRNPLAAPRVLDVDQRHLEEGRLIAATMRALVDNGTLIGAEDAARPLAWEDILLLVRNRTHLAWYEQALREFGVPYASANRGTLLESQEAQDLVSLLEFLVAPFNNLALAGLLRSPLFACTDQDLIALASLRTGGWHERLAVAAAQDTATAPLKRAYSLLAQWRALVDTLPVHDLLDRIFAQGDLLRRYQAAYPAHLQHRVLANLTRFIELALEVDSGRYPTIGHFVARLQLLRQQEEDAPDEGQPSAAGARIRIMTIHGAKGLEAPVVFLAGTTHTRAARKAYRALVDWPTEAEQPRHFLLPGKQDDLDALSRTLLEQHAAAEAREDANLLYVAVTRAKQLLYLSGCAPASGSELGWYGHARACLTDAGADASGPWCLTSGAQPVHAARAGLTKTVLPAIDPRWSRPLTIAPAAAILAPSRAVAGGAGGVDANSQTRGLVIHRLLELLCTGAPRADLPARVTAEFGLAADSSELRAWLAEASAVIAEPALARVFDDAHYSTVYNEVPVQYLGGDAAEDARLVSGVIDRLLVSERDVWVIDYKTHPGAREPAAQAALLAQYRPQLEHYRAAVARLWPGRSVRAGLLFTAGRQLLWLEPASEPSGPTAR